MAIPEIWFSQVAPKTRFTYPPCAQPQGKGGKPGFFMPLKTRLNLLLVSHMGTIAVPGYTPDQDFAELVCKSFPPLLLIVSPQDFRYLLQIHNL
jgi:hypothetical protein